MLNSKALAASASAAKVYVEDVFSTWLYTGNGSTQTITNGIDLSGKGGLVWAKDRSNAENNVLIDTARGGSQLLYSNTTAAQGTPSAPLTFTSTGYSISGNGAGNTSPDNYASWTFRKAAKFFDIVTWTTGGTLQADRRISHNLGSVPGCIIIKVTNIAGDNWWTYHRSQGRSQYLSLNTTNASTSQANSWGSSDPTSTDFGFNETIFSASGWTYVAYLFAHDAGGFGDSGNDSVVKCGSFTGTGFVDLGWEPQFVLLKASSTTSNWFLMDNMRAMQVADTGAPLYANTSDSEQSGGASVKIGATGFSYAYASTNTYIYIAIRRGPMKTPTDATKVFSQIARSGTGSSATITGSGFPIDFVLGQERTAIGLNGGIAVDRMRGAAAYLRTPVANAEGSNTAVVSALDNMNGFTVGASDGLNGSSSTYINWLFRRAPGFMDVVVAQGTSTGKSDWPHSLKVAPEFIIRKSRTNAYDWHVWHKDVSGVGYLTSTSAWFTAQTAWTYDGVNINMTATTFSTSATAAINSSADSFVTYLFASCPGVSKVGSYTGTGTTQQINCGFASGSRLVLIKRTDSTGNWYIWDSARGIIANNDPYLLLNSTAAEVTNTDYIDPYSAGFEISSTAPAEINANGGSYIFLAVA